MRLVAYPFQPRIVPALAVAAFLATTALANATPVAPAAETQAPSHVITIAAREKIDTRVSDLRAKLQITDAQEELWQKVARVMRDNASRMDTLKQERDNPAAPMTAVDDLKSYGEIADAHADGVRKLTFAFQGLYDSMPDRQKKNADAVFRNTPHHALRRN